MIHELKERTDIFNEDKFEMIYLQFDALIWHISKKELPLEISNSINEHIDALNAMPDSKKELRIQIRTRQSKIIRL